MKRIISLSLLPHKHRSGFVFALYSGYDVETELSETAMREAAAAMDGLVTEEFLSRSEKMPGAVVTEFPEYIIEKPIPATSGFIVQ